MSYTKCHTLSGRRGRHPMVIGFIITYAISAYQQKMLWVRFPFRRGVLDTALCDKGYQWLAVGRWLYPCASVSSTNKSWPSRYNWTIVESVVEHHNPPTHHALSQTITTNTRVRVLGMCNRITGQESIKFVYYSWHFILIVNVLFGCITSNWNNLSVYIIGWLVGLCCLTPLSTLFQIYLGGQF